MFAKLLALLAQNQFIIEFATGNTLFGLSVGALIAAGGWVLLMRLRNHNKM